MCALCDAVFVGEESSDAAIIAVDIGVVKLDLCSVADGRTFFYTSGLNDDLWFGEFFDLLNVVDVNPQQCQGSRC